MELGPNNKNVLVKVSCPALGDTLCSTPAIRKVALSYGHKIDVMTHRSEIFKNSPYVDNVLNINADSEEGYNEVFDTYNQWIKLNVGMRSDIFHDKPMEIKLHNMEARQLHALGVGMHLYPEESHYDFIPDAMSERAAKVDKNYLVFHVTENWPSRTWSVQKWQRMVDLVKSHTGFKIVTVGMSHKEPTYNGMHLDKGVIKLENVDLDYCDLKDSPISELWHIINNASGLVTFDSGPMHLAGTTDTEIFTIGSSIRKEKIAPWRHSSQDYKFHFIGGECKLFCASNPKYSVKEWNTINAMHYAPECAEGFTEFKCQPSPDQVLMSIITNIDNIPKRDHTIESKCPFVFNGIDGDKLLFNFTRTTNEKYWLVIRDITTGLRRDAQSYSAVKIDGNYWWVPAPSRTLGLGPIAIEVYDKNHNLVKVENVHFDGGTELNIKDTVLYNDQLDDNNYSTFWEIFIHGEYNQPNCMVESGDVVVDIGANYGFFTLDAINKGAKKVWAYEPSPKAYEHLKGLATTFTEIKPFNSAVSDEPGVLMMNISDTTSAVNHVVKHADIFNEVGDTVQVDALSINQVLDGVGHIDLLKIDCEGSELEIFNAIDDRLGQIKKIVCETHSPEINTVVYNRLNSAGFRIKTVENLIYAHLD